LDWKDLQLLGCYNLLDVFGVAVEHEYQCLIIEVGYLILERGDVVDAITLRQVKARYYRSGRLIIPQRVLLGREGPENFSMQ
jgi:hypothetical protein